VVFVLVAGVAAVATFLLPARNRHIPEASFSLLDGRTIALQELRSRPVLVAFWATSCAPCVEEIPDLVRLYRELQPRGLEMIAVAMPYDPPLHVQTFARERGLPYPIAVDTTGAAIRAFGEVRAIPTTYLLDPQGAIALKQLGKLDVDRVRKLVAPFLKAAADTGALPPP
jgi:peroxiredoxin